MCLQLQSRYIAPHTKQTFNNHVFSTSTYITYNNLLFSVCIRLDHIVATNKELVNLNYCKLSTQIKNDTPNVGNVLDNDLVLQTPLMSHKGMQRFLYIYCQIHIS